MKHDVIFPDRLKVVIDKADIDEGKNYIEQNAMTLAISKALGYPILAKWKYAYSEFIIRRKDIQATTVYYARYAYSRRAQQFMNLELYGLAHTSSLPRKFILKKTYSIQKEV